MAEQIDDLQLRGYRIIQDEMGFRFGSDAVLLANYAAPRLLKKDVVLDLCTGSGIVPLLLAAKQKAAKIYGLEIQPEVADRAARSVSLNREDGHIEIREGDVREIENFFPAESMNAVTVNPPYMKAGLRSPDSAKEIARHEVLCTFSDVVRAARYVLKSSGRFFLVHRTERLAEILHCLVEERLEPKKLRLIYPFPGGEANLFLLEAVKYGNSGMRAEPALYMYESAAARDRNYHESFQELLSLANAEM